MPYTTPEALRAAFRASPDAAVFVKRLLEITPTSRWTSLFAMILDLRPGTLWHSACLPD